MKAAASRAEESPIVNLGLVDEITELRGEIERWIAAADGEMQDSLRWQLITASKYFRPLTVFSAYRATQAGPIPRDILRSALLVELFHNVTLVIDDIVDHSDARRERATLHKKYGELPALMASGYIVADGFRIAGDDLPASRLLCELLMRLAVAECRQWRLRRQPLGVEDWRKIAAEDTGSMFEVCACLGDRSERLRRFGGLLGLLYHGCDDVADVRGTTALGGGGYDDLRDGILTLPAALAIRDPEVARLFAEPAPDDLADLAAAFKAQLPAAEAYLDAVAEDAKREAQLFAADPEPLVILVEHTRQLAHR